MSNSNSNAQNLFNAISGALSARQSAIIAATGKQSEDIASIFKSGVFALTLPACELMLEAGLTPEIAKQRLSVAVKGQTGFVGVKACKRLTEFFGALASKNFAQLDAVTVASIGAMHIVGNTGAGTELLKYACTRSGSDNTSSVTKGKGFQRFFKLLTQVHVNTYPTQCSRTFGKNGFLTILGATTGEPSKGTLKYNPAHPTIVRLSEVVGAATDGQLMQLVAQIKKGA